MPSFDVNQIRSHFPIFQQKIYGNPLAFLDTAASAQKPQCVIDAYQNFYGKMYANVHRGVYYLSNISTAEFENTRNLVAKFINAPSPDDCIFVRGTTEAINLVAYCFAEKNLNPDDEILVTQMEHHANLVPWQLVCKKYNAKIKYIPMLADGTLDLSKLDSLISSKTKILAVTHVSNSIGTINPIKKIISAARKKNIPVLVDGAQSIVHEPNIDVQALDCDFFVFSAHKLYGPTGIGVLYAKRKWLDQFGPYQGGGSMITQVTMESSEYLTTPHRFEAGTPAIAEAYAFGKTIEYLNTIDRVAAAKYEHALLEYTTSELTKIPGLQIIGSTPEKSGIISFIIDGIHPHDLGTIVDQYGVCIRVGHHCNMPLMAFFGVPATARVSLGMYNLIEEIDQLIQAIYAALKFFKKI